MNNYVTALCAGSGFDKRATPGQSEKEEDEAEWDELGKKAFEGVKGEEVRNAVVEGLLSRGGGSGWCDEQVSRISFERRSADIQVIVLRRLWSFLLCKEEDWQGAARALSQIPLEGTSR